MRKAWKGWTLACSFLNLVFTSASKWQDCCSSFVHHLSLSISISMSSFLVPPINYEVQHFRRHIGANSRVNSVSPVFRLRIKVGSMTVRENTDIERVRGPK